MKAEGLVKTSVPEAMKALLGSYLIVAPPFELNENEAIDSETLREQYYGPYFRNVNRQTLEDTLMELAEVSAMKEELEDIITANEESYDRLNAVRKSGEAALSDEMARMRYRIDFANFHAHLLDGAFQKIVLSRSTFDHMPDNKKYAADLFCMACQLYPRMFVSLVTTPKSGTWMMATPETLLDGKGRNWRTIARRPSINATQQAKGRMWMIEYGEGPVSVDNSPSSTS